MLWNDGYFDKYGNRLSDNGGNQDVYDSRGNRIGYYKNGTIYDKDGKQLVKGPFGEEPISTAIDEVIDLFDPFKPF